MPAGNTHTIILSPRITDLRLSPFYYLLCGMNLAFHSVSLTKSMNSYAQDRVSKLLHCSFGVCVVNYSWQGSERRLFVHYRSLQHFPLFFPATFFLLAHFVRSTKLTAGFLSSICFPYIHFASLTLKKTLPVLSLRAQIDNFIGSISFDPSAPYPTAPCALDSSVSLGPGTSSSSLSELLAVAPSSKGFVVDNWPAIPPLWLLSFTLARRRERLCLHLAPAVRPDYWKRGSIT